MPKLLISKYINEIKIDWKINITNLKCEHKDERAN